MPLKITYIGGPTALLEFGGVRILTDPTFDPGGEIYQPAPSYTLHKITGPAQSAEDVGHVDVVLLSHDHHFDNLDHAGRAALNNADVVLTTRAGAERLGNRARGLSPWESADIPGSDGRVLRVIGAPARHGPEGGDRGPVTGFILFFTDAPGTVVYVSGDTVWFEGVAEVSRRYPVKAAVLFMGAAKVSVAGPSHLTFTVNEGVLAAQAFKDAVIIPLHFEGWAHFTESRTEIEHAFKDAGMEDRLLWLAGGKAVEVSV
jgi:L-ascorbate metabolism protein UlaG (beta-lactamase superfamily)